MNITDYEVVELDEIEQQLIEGGSRLSYWLGYIEGFIRRPSPGDETLMLCI